MIIQREHPAHWYGWDKEKQCAYPVHEVPYADPSKGFRPTTLKDAKKLNLMKSVTAVCHQLNKPGLESWKQEQLILSALTLPRPDGFTDDQWAHRIIEDAETQAQKARDEGLDIHEAAQHVLQAKADGFIGINEYAFGIPKVMAPFIQWMDKMVEGVLATEELVCSTKLGVAGREDAIVVIEGKRTYLDIKGQDVKDGSPTYYPEWLWQLAGYRLCDNGDRNDDLMSIVIDRKTGILYGKVWTHEEADQGVEMFWLLCRMWDIRNKHQFKL